MDPARVFLVMNVLPLPIWLVWITAPGSRLAYTLARSTWPWAVLGGAYALFLGVALGQAGGIDPASFATLAGVMALFDSEWAALAGWTHYLCFDLFVARWIVNDAPRGGYWLAPILFLTLMVGPVGLLCYLAARGPLGYDR
jgi:hypothetical protein